MFNRTRFLLLLSGLVILQVFIVSAGTGTPSSSDGSGKEGCYSFLRKLTRSKPVVTEESFSKPKPTFFDIISLKQLTNLKVTSKQEAGSYYRDNFVNKVIGKGTDILSNLNRTSQNINCFSEFIEKISVRGGNLEIFQVHNFPSLKEIEFCHVNLKSMECLEHILPQIESLTFYKCNLNADVDKIFLQHTKSLKELFVSDDGGKQSTFVGTTNKWLDNEYYSLKHLSLNSRKENRKVIDFLERHLKLHYFSVPIEFLMKNIDYLMKSNRTLDVLSILHGQTDLDPEKFNNFQSKILELKDQQFFQYLRLYYGNSKNQYVYQSKLLELVKVLNIEKSRQQFDLSSMNNLEQLFVYNASFIMNLEKTVKKLQNLEFLYCCHVSIDRILPFVQQSPNLKAIKINYIETGSFKREASLNIFALNEKRKHLKKPSKITFYVNEHIYLATKFEYAYVETEFIDVKRFDSYEGVRDF